MRVGGSAAGAGRCGVAARVPGGGVDSAGSVERAQNVGEF